MVEGQRFIHLIQSLSIRLVLGMIAIQMVLIPLLLTSILYFINSTMKEQFINDVRSTAGLISTILAPINPILQRQTAISILDEIILGGNIVYAEILLPENKIITSLLDYQNNKLEFIEDFAFNSNADETYFIALPIFITNLESAAFLRIGFDEIPLKEQFQKIRHYLYLILASYILINLVLVFYLGKRTTQPLTKLRHASRMIRHGFTNINLDVESPVSEIRDLAIDLDLMRQALVSQASALEYQANHDALTGLPNRVLLEDRLQQTISINSRNNKSFSLLLINLDRFKTVNETLGHQVGDEVLRQTASRLHILVHEGDTVARLGGDEFALLLQGLDENVDSVAQAIVADLQRSFDVGTHTVHLGASIGVVLFPSHSDSAEQLMRQVDLAMLAAKKSDLHYQIYDSSKNKISHDRLTLCEDFRKAISENEIVLHYQPKIDLQTGAVNGVEALARWQHPERGLLTPEYFIPFAEKSGLIGELTESLLQTAINDAASWYHSGQAIEVSLNLSPKNLLDEKLPQRIENLLITKKIPAQYLSLEITENAIIREPEQARDILLTLKVMGVRSIIDDFGTGYSSLIYLRHLPVNEIKIDKSFVVAMLHNQDDAHIVQATIRMAHDLELLVTAEGIESESVSRVLQELDCDKGQGYYYSPALTVEQLNRWRVKYNSNLQKQQQYSEKNA